MEQTESISEQLEGWKQTQRNVGIMAVCPLTIAFACDVYLALDAREPELVKDFTKFILVMCVFFAVLVWRTSSNMRRLSRLKADEDPATENIADSSFVHTSPEAH